MNKRLINFVKYSATGNDFIMIDNRREIIPEKAKKQFAKKYCLTKLGIGADGAVFLEKSVCSDFKMRIINSDGSEAEMCGNASRAIAHFAFERKIAKKTMSFETLAGLINAEIKTNNVVKVKLTEPAGLKLNLSLSYNNKKYTGYFINTGVPHFVLFVKDIEKINVYDMGRFIRYHKLFQPKGTNVNFVQAINKHEIKIRTYERGVENETLACGTGSTAGAIISSVVKGVKPPVKVITHGKEIVRVYFERYDTYIENVYLEGKVNPIFLGSIQLG